MTKNHDFWIKWSKIVFSHLFYKTVEKWQYWNYQFKVNSNKIFVIYKGSLKYIKYYHFSNFLFKIYQTFTFILYPLRIFLYFGQITHLTLIFFLHLEHFLFFVTISIQNTPKFIFHTLRMFFLVNFLFRFTKHLLW